MAPIFISPSRTNIPALAAAQKLCKVSVPYSSQAQLAPCVFHSRQSKIPSNSMDAAFRDQPSPHTATLSVNLVTTQRKGDAAVPLELQHRPASKTVQSTAGAWLRVCGGALECRGGDDSGTTDVRGGKDFRSKRCGRSLRSRELETSYFAQTRTLSQDGPSIFWLRYARGQRDAGVIRSKLTTPRPSVR